MSDAEVAAHLTEFSHNNAEISKAYAPEFVIPVYNIFVSITKNDKEAALVLTKNYVSRGYDCLNKKWLKKEYPALFKKIFEGITAPQTTTK
ncbi:hypothetical protein [Mesonia aestuariivivens]|uniref:Uncharacterized protein n=1 Tax=Mesonia aestuariivivens TaxID=2796128 RepID=A0ABS6W465_9FLAO|nr:hypothetical protein [Mesonia aestuariivivens]MBW2962276.1 hypothetical protein [Mesonia aestuariivivens]